MYMIEGEWLGYRSMQDHVCHREYASKSKQKFVDRVKAIGFGITFTDGTTLRLTVTEVSRKKLPTKDGYGKLIHDCAHAGVSSVQALCDLKKQGAT